MEEWFEILKTRNPRSDRPSGDKRIRSNLWNFFARKKLAKYLISISVDRMMKKIRIITKPGVAGLIIGRRGENIKEYQQWNQQSWSICVEEKGSRTAPTCSEPSKRRLAETYY
tara:strand:- start:14926 stop:15264 length:339 start_codon:yes stop_codon:yes gene_type:complete